MGRSRLPRPDPARRRHLLYGAGCFRVAWYAINSEPFRLMLDAVEAAADGGTYTDVASLRGEQPPPGTPVPWDAAEALRFAASHHYVTGYHGAEESAARVHGYILAAVPGAAPLLDGVRDDILGRPAVVFDERWRTPTVVALARGMYQSRDFTGMPALADELQEAGCDDPKVLEHARNPAGVHARGCWLVDLILGK